MTKNFINILSTAGKLGYEAMNQVNDHIFHKIEQHFVQGNYVTREEHEVLRAQIIKLQEEITKLKNSNNTVT